MTMKHYSGISLVVMATLVVGAVVWQFSKELIYVAIFLAIATVITVSLYLYRLWDDVRTRQITRYHLKVGQEHERRLQAQQIEHQCEMERSRLHLEGERIALERERLHLTTQLDFRRVIVPGGHTVVFTDEEQGYIPIAAAHAPQIARTGQNEDPTSLAPAIEAISAVVRYDDIKQQVPAGLSLLGIHPKDGNLELIEPRLYKIVWFVGGSDTGKTNTVYGKTSDIVERFGARLLVADPHAHKKDSLTRKLAPLYHALYRDRNGKAVPPAVNPKQITSVLQTFLDEFNARLEGADCSVPVLLVADEIGNMLRNEEIAPMIRKLVQTCGDEIRGFNMFFFGISQRAAYLKFLRDAAQTIIVHGLLQESEAMLAVNNDKALARKVQEFARHKGRTVVYGYEFDSMILQQPLHTIPQNEQATRVVEGWLAGNPPAMDDLPEHVEDAVGETYRQPEKPVEMGITEEDRTDAWFEESMADGYHQPEKPMEPAEIGVAIFLSHAQKIKIPRILEMDAEEASQNEIIEAVWEVKPKDRAGQDAARELRRIRAYLAQQQRFLQKEAQ